MKSREERIFNFEQEYSKLNPAQRKAVDCTEGPVMVIAGPGTGKTQILATRIANLLLKNPILPSNILCLTYTDAGVIAMKKRLSEMIGPESYDIGIFTYHAFCNKVISDHAQEFNLFGEHALADDLDIIEILLDILTKLPSTNPLFSLREYYSQVIRNLKKLFQDIKKENWDVVELQNAIKHTLDHLHLDPTLVYLRNSKENKKGDLNQRKYKEAKLKYEKSLAAIQVFSKYQEVLNQKNLYDYDDLINWVIDKFKMDEDFLAAYQEKYQYILVDEYQDTNGSQMEIIRLLCSYWDSPNIFAVGDDDQAIYRFQGANLSNMSDFIQRYHPELILLQENYRSTQAILDASSSTINYNQDRLVHVIDGLSKELMAAGKNKIYNSLPAIIQYSDAYSEVQLTCQKINDLIKHQSISPSSIAVLFRKNDEAESYARVLSHLGIPFKQSKTADVLAEPLIVAILNILQYLHIESKTPFGGDESLSHILHQPFIGLDTIDLAKVFWHFNLLKENLYATNQFSSKPFSLRLLIGDSTFLENAGINSKETFIEFSKSIENIIAEKELYTIQILIEKLFYSFNIIEYILKSVDKANQLQILHSFFNYIKDLSVKKPEIKLDELLQIFPKLKEYNIPIPVLKYSGIAEGVLLSTMHSSKGLEFDTVFIVNQTESSWKRKQDSQYLLPDPYIGTSNHSDEDDRRLFYVAMTRAERQLYVSYPKIISAKKLQNPCRFINELKGSGGVSFNEEILSEDQFNDHLTMNLSFYRRNFDQLDHDYLIRFLEKFEMSATSLQKYLKCPLTFYHEIVLRIPGARTAYMGFGNAIHYALEKYISANISSEELDLELLKFNFMTGMRRYKSHFTETEYNRYSDEGLRHLQGFLKSHSDDWKSAIQIKTEVPFKNKRYQSVPISGKIDRIDIYPTGIRVIDYKTGNPNRAKEKTKAPDEKQPHGGEYWLQMAFYRILTNTDSILYPSFLGGCFYYIVPDNHGQYHSSYMEPALEDVEKVGKMITESYEKIKKGIFTPGCGEEDCIWCNYYQQKKLASISEEDEIEED